MLVSSFANRLANALNFRNMKPSEIVRKSEDLHKNGIINKPLTKPLMSHYLKGTYEAKQDNLYALSLILNIDEAWLMGYDVPMERIDNNIQGMDKKSEGSAVVFIYGSIPAGTPMECIEDIIDTEEIPIDMLKGGKQYFGLKVKGDSMYPEYLDKDILICQKVEDCNSGDDCIVMVNGYDGTFKRVIKNEEKQTIRLQPLNTTLDENGNFIYEPKTYSKEEIEKLPVKIIGKVVELRRKK